ncbi:hypothetical protein [Taibaiella koreensis]|uniref:hypothetical protein n=1 Tax=Taibaiella koreensis TaxID=1268548 RepID=UPI000E59B523|nr:hypothetical protein [Taibaiella koreensis]
MAKEFDALVQQITDLRLQKTELNGNIYLEKQGLITNQYLLLDALNRNSKGEEFQRNIEQHKAKIKDLSFNWTELNSKERDMVATLQESFGGFTNLVNQMNDRYPILFFPVRIETAFSTEQARQLWVRIYPDDIAVDTHEEALTQSEMDEAMRYWRSWVDNPANLDRVQAWDLLCRSFGAERAAWVALQMKPVNLVTANPSDPLDFPVLTPKQGSWSKQPVTNIMPDAFVIYAYANDGSLITYQTANIPDELKMGIDPTIDPDDPSADPMSFDQQNIAGRKNELVANPNVDWMIDFDAAIANGLGARIGLTDSQYNNGFSKILVLGVKSSLNVTESQNRLQALINNHHYTDGFSLLKQGTSTNNTDTDYAGYSFVEFGNNTTFATEQGQALFNPVYVQRQKKDGQVLCEALGIDFDVMYHIFQSNGTDISNAMNTGNLLYQVSFGYTANELMPIFGTRSSNNNELKQFFSDYVRSRGALPSIRSGTQPYGILPASVYSRINWDTDPNAGLYRRIFDYTAALDRHWTNAVASLEHVGFSGLARAASPPSSSPVQQLSDVLSQHAVSTEYVQRVGVGAGYIWNNLEYAALKYPEQRERWSQEQMSRMERTISESGLPLQYDHKSVQINYLETQSNMSLALVADDNTPPDAPLPKIGKRKYNMLEVLYRATFDQLRDEDFSSLGLSDKDNDRFLKNNMLYRFVRQSLMLEFYEAACELLRIDESQRGESEFVNIVESASPPTFQRDAEGQVGPMGALTYGPSRLQLMQTPYKEVTISTYLSTAKGDRIPEMKNLVEAKASLLQLTRVNVRDLNLLTAEMVDSVSYRFDTWRLALVNQRLNALRGIRDGSSARNMGIYLGAYGWVTDVRRTTDLQPVPPPTQDGQFESGIVHDLSNKGYIHAPSINQAVTGAVMLSGYTDRANSNMENPLSVNLSSERVRAALDIMDGIRNGQNLSVLLGFELERRLHTFHNALNVNPLIQNLRRYYPVDAFVVDPNTQPGIVDKVKARNVINGAKVIEIYKTDGNISTIAANGGIGSGDPLYNPLQTEIDWIWDLMDAVGDIAMAEGLFHVVQGNPVKGGAIADAISKGNLVAEPDVVSSPKSGLEVGQRFTMHFTTADVSELFNDWDGGVDSRRKDAEPYINKWLSGILPAPGNIICTVTDQDHNSQVVTAAELALQPADLMYLVGEELADDDSMLSLIVKKYVRKTYGYTRATTLTINYAPTTGASNISFTEVLPVLLYARKVITASRPLTTHDYMLPGEAQETLRLYNITEINTRATTARSVLITAKNDLNTALTGPFSFTAVSDALYVLSRFGFEQTVYEFINDTDAEAEETLKAWGASVLAQAQARITASNFTIPVPGPADDPVPFVNGAIDSLKAIFGGSFAVLPLFSIRPQEQAYFVPMLNGSSSLLQDNGNQSNELLMDEWLGSIAKVRKNAADYEMLSILAGAVQFTAFASRPFLPLQIPYAGDSTERWLGAAVNAGNTAALKEGRIAIGASLPASYELTGDQAGILVDEWIDVIPAREQTSGISFHHNQPNAKAPQCLLLGLTPQITGNWRWDDLVDMLNETLELAKKRAVDYEQISSSVVGQLPGMIMPFAQSGNLIGLSAAHILSVNP